MKSNRKWSWIERAVRAWFRARRERKADAQALRRIMLPQTGTPSCGTCPKRFRCVESPHKVGYHQSREFRWPTISLN